jgi:hypothetical protein
MIRWLMRLLLWRFARRAGPIGLLSLLGGPWLRLALLVAALRYFGGRGGDRAVKAPDR